MGKYYCDYCDIYLTHDSMNARKAHNTGRNHVSNVRDYFASLGHDTAQSIIDQIVAQHESGGRAMYAAPSMRLGAGFLNPNPMAPAPNMSYPPFPATGAFPPQGAAPAVRPPFPPNASMPPFPPPSGVMPPFAPTGQPGAFRPPAVGALPGNTPPFPPSQSSPFAPQQNSPLPNGTAAAPPTGFTPAPGPPTGGQPGIHPDRLRMMGV